MGNTFHNGLLIIEALCPFPTWARTTKSVQPEGSPTTRSSMSLPSVDDPGIAVPHLTLQTVIGISVSIAGNVLISLALNLQKLAHLRLHHQREDSLPDTERENRPPGRDTSTRHIIHPDTATRFGAAQQALQENNQFQPLLPRRSPSQPPPSSYGLGPYHVSVAGDDARSRKSSSAARPRRHPRKHHFVSPFLPLRFMLGGNSVDSSNVRADLSDHLAMSVEDPFPRRNARTSHQGEASSPKLTEDGRESDYLRSKLWFAIHVLFECLIQRVHVGGRVSF